MPWFTVAAEWTITAHGYLLGMKAGDGMISSPISRRLYIFNDVL
jgi:hypothetical protein